ncbi:MAG: anaerobic glycerol-3-phosphate dehydrogenase subunit B [Bacteroidales bacterium]|jgi:glycerol-3-phosphate dehydrogenase subunit B|nr:anaerobic glycerol-3-phosphate dehydrogenase subunit B [Bacteroidales bacterium]
MTYDVVIIGGGLAGLTCAMRALQKGRRCAVITWENSMLSSSSGSFDLLNALPDGTPVSEPLKAIDMLKQQSQTHPYAKMGVKAFAAKAAQAEVMLSELGCKMQGSSLKNHYRITPVGLAKQAWLTFDGMFTTESPDKLPFSSAQIFYPVGFLDFYPRFIAEEWAKKGVQVETVPFLFSKITRVQRIARIINKNNNAQVVMLPSCTSQFMQLRELINRPAYMLATMPPSLLGLNFEKILLQKVTELGGDIFIEDKAIKAEWAGNSIKAVYSQKMGSIPFKSEKIVLATGGLAGRGLEATRVNIREPLFNLDVEQDSSRENWVNTQVLQKQPYMYFGIKTDNDFRAIKNGNIIDNLYVAGAGLEGFNPIEEGCGAGVSILTGLYVGEII